MIIFLLLFKNNNNYNIITYKDKNIHQSIYNKKDYKINGKIEKYLKELKLEKISKNMPNKIFTKIYITCKMK